MRSAAGITIWSSKDNTDSERDPPSGISFVVRHQEWVQDERSATDNPARPAQPRRALDRRLCRGCQGQSADMPRTVKHTLSPSYGAGTLQLA